MRLAAVLVLVGACASQGPSSENVPPSQTEAGPGSGQCTQDADCPQGEVCTRDASCVAPSEERTIHVTWTIAGQPAGDATCARQPDLVLDLGVAANGAWFGYAPVPCKEGAFTIDRLSDVYQYAWLGVDTWARGTVGTIDAGGDVAIDLAAY